jgi:hypothetical protein
MARVTASLTATGIASIGQSSHQSSSGRSAGHRDHREEQQQPKPSPQTYANVPLIFEAERESAARRTRDLQSFEDFIVVHNLSSQMHVVPHYHGPKLIKLASYLDSTKN